MDLPDWPVPRIVRLSAERANGFALRPRRAPDEGCPLDKIRARYEHRNPQVLGHPSQRRCDMPNVAVCVYCSRKIDEKEKTVNAPQAAGEIAHLNCAQKTTSAPRR